MNKTRGFTIIELMVILAILAITLAFGVPQINNLVVDNRMVDALNRLSANLSYARSEAIKRTTPITVRPNTANSWDTGWVIFIDTNRDGIIDAGETLLRNEGTLNLPATATIRCDAACAGIIYNADGANSTGADITITLDDTRLKHKTILTISGVGRVGIGSRDPY